MEKNVNDDLFDDKLKLAEEGDPSAQFSVAWAYDNGEGVEQDFYKAAQWYKKSAEGGNCAAQNNLGVLYAYGHGVEQSYELAAKYYQMAADNGSVVAKCNLASYYFDGTGVPQDYNKAYALYKEAAEAGDKDALVGLARCYERCAGVRDPQRAFELYSQTAESGDAIAQYNLAECYFSGTGTEKNVQKALEWYEKSANQDYLPAQIKAADINWERGNYAAAVKYYDWARSNGNTYAQFSYAYALYYGKGIRKDQGSGLYMLQRLAEKGDKNSTDMLAELRAHGQETDHTKVSQALMEANPNLYFYRLQHENEEIADRRRIEDAQFTCKSDDPNVVFECGEDYFYGRKGKTQNWHKAGLQYIKAGNLGHALSMYKAGLCYLGKEGTYVREEQKKHAEEWFKKAADAGYRGAFKHLKHIDKYLNLAAEYGDGEACLAYGKNCLKKGDQKGAVKWFVKGYEGGNADCLAELKKGDGEEFRAFKKERAEKGEAWAQYLVAEDMYFRGWKEEAEEWYKKSAEQNYGPACKQLALNYASGGDDYIHWLKKAVDAGTPEVAENLAQHYVNIKDYESAAKYFEKALSYRASFKHLYYCVMEYLDVADSLADCYAQDKVNNAARAVQLHTEIVSAEDDKRLGPQKLEHLRKLKNKHARALAKAYLYGLGCNADYQAAEKYYRMLEPVMFKYAEQSEIRSEIDELSKHQCKKCGKYANNPIEKSGLFGTKKCCPYCGAKLPK